MNKMKETFKWLLTRKWIYLIAFVHFALSRAYNNNQNINLGFMVGQYLGILFLWMIFILFIQLIPKNK